MTTVLAILNSAYRETNLVAIGATLTTNQLNEGLDRLNSQVASTYGFEVGNPLVDWPLGADASNNQQPSWTADDWSNLDSNVRMVVLPTFIAGVVLLPSEPQDGARVAIVDPSSLLATHVVTLSGNGRTIEGAQTQILNTNGLNRLWLYRADLGDWVRVNVITDVTTQFPFPTEFDDYFTTMLAMRLNPRYGRAMDPATAATLQRSMGQLRARYRQKINVPADSGVLALTRNYGSWRSKGHPSKISRGRARWMV